MDKRVLLAVLFVVSMGSGAVFADPAMLMDHNAATGPRHDALMKCVQAARRDSTIGSGLMFSTRMGVSDRQAGSQTFVLKGTAWQDGARVPVTARCVVGPQQTVASVTRVDAPAVADATR